MNGVEPQFIQNPAEAMRPLPESAVFSDPDYFIWGASMLRDDDGMCHLFYSRWLKSLGFNAWVTHSEIAHAVSESPIGPYRHVDVVLPARGGEYWDGCCTHNPSVLKHDGKFYLYYMGNTGDGKTEPDPTLLNWMHRNNQRIGVAVADNLSGPWMRRDAPLIDVGELEGDPDSLMISNPSVVQREDGRFMMVYKAVGKQEALPFGGPVIHLEALSDRPDGVFEKQSDPVFARDHVKFPSEDPCVWMQDGRYYAILKDMEGYFTGVGRSLVLFESNDGMRWSMSEPGLVSDRTVVFEDGNRKQFDYLERPQLYLEDGIPTVLFCAVRYGDESANIHIPLR